MTHALACAIDGGLWATLVVSGVALLTLIEHRGPVRLGRTLMAATGLLFIGCVALTTYIANGGA